MLRERILLLLGIKEEGKYIDFNHIFDKVSRDEAIFRRVGKSEIKEDEIKEELEKLVSLKLVERKDNLFAISQKGKEELRKILKDAEKAKKLNLSYRLVFEAINYYKEASPAIFPFLKNRAASVVKIFSNDSEPFSGVKAIFVRYAKYKPVKVFVQIKSESEIMEKVYDHAIDFIPYVHELKSRLPSWFILDLDAGEKIKRHEHGFEVVKMVAEKICEVLESFEIKPCIKFSGSRGMQIWARFENEKLKNLTHTSDLFSVYRELAIFVQKKAEERIKEAGEEARVISEIVGKGKEITTSKVARKEEREEKILVDWSSMKINGDVRAPFSMHYKTGLISCPIERKEIKSFEISDAEPEKVAKKIEKLKKAFELEESDARKLYKAYVKEFKKQETLA